MERERSEKDGSRGWHKTEKFISLIYVIFLCEKICIWRVIASLRGPAPGWRLGGKAGMISMNAVEI